jgi:hypothetical protein
LAADWKLPVFAMRANIRSWTAIVVIGICAFSVVRGLSIVRFSLAMASIGSSESGAESIGMWATVPGVASTALQSKLKKKINPSDLTAANSRREALSAILSIKPLSSTEWLLLSGVQLIMDQPMDQVLATLMLSALTGPNEGYLMADRGIFGASLWEDLSPDLRRRTAIDLAAEEPPESGKFRAVLSTKSEGVRNELKAAMLATGLSPKEVEKRLGF